MTEVHEVNFISDPKTKEPPRKTLETKASKKQVIEEEIERLCDVYGKWGGEARLLSLLDFYVCVEDNRNLVYPKPKPNDKLPNEKTPSVVAHGNIVAIREDEQSPTTLIYLDSGYTLFIDQYLIRYIVKDWEL